MSAILPRLNPATLRVVGEPPSESGAIDLTVGDLIWMVGAETDDGQQFATREEAEKYVSCTRLAKELTRDGFDAICDIIDWLHANRDMVLESLDHLPKMVYVVMVWSGGVEDARAVFYDHSAACVLADDLNRQNNDKNAVVYTFEVGVDRRASS